MPRRIDEVQHVLLAVLGVVREPDRVGLDRDAALALEIHRVEHLRFHLARLKRTGHFEKPIRQRGLAVVDMRDDGEVSYVARIHGL